MEENTGEGRLGCVERRVDLFGADPDSQRHRHRGGVPELQVLIAVNDGRVTAQPHVTIRAVRVDAAAVPLEDVRPGEDGGVVARAGALAGASGSREAGCRADEVVP